MSVRAAELRERPMSTCNRQAAFLEVVVVQALEDLDQGHLDVESALRLVARVAFEEGARHHVSRWC